MTKKELRTINQIKTVTMRDIKSVAKDRAYRLGYKSGFNVCRRLFRTALGFYLLTGKMAPNSYTVKTYKSSDFAVIKIKKV